MFHFLRQNFSEEIYKISSVFSVFWKFRLDVPKHRVKHPIFSKLRRMWRQKCVTLAHISNFSAPSAPKLGHFRPKMPPSLGRCPPPIQVRVKLPFKHHRNASESLPNSKVWVTIQTASLSQMKFPIYLTLERSELRPTLCAYYVKPQYLFPIFLTLAVARNAI